MQQPSLKKYKLETIIHSYCKIKNNSVWLNDSEFLKVDQTEDLTSFLAGLYKNVDLNYPKFFKMDKLCKLGILATELLIRNTAVFNSIPKNDIALVFTNNASSLESDRNHANAIADKQHYFPSPSVFVYTLPNIVIGEIAIKHKITGENAFFVTEKFDAKLMYNYSSLLLENKNASLVICAWVNVDGNSYETFAYCIKNGNFKEVNDGFYKPHHPDIIHNLYSL